MRPQHMVCCWQHAAMCRAHSIRHASCRLPTAQQQAPCTLQPVAHSPPIALLPLHAGGCPSHAATSHVAASHSLFLSYCPALPPCARHPLTVSAGYRASVTTGITIKICLVGAQSSVLEWHLPSAPRSSAADKIFHASQDAPHLLQAKAGPAMPASTMCGLALNASSANATAPSTQQGE